MSGKTALWRIRRVEKTHCCIPKHRTSCRPDPVPRGFFSAPSRSGNAADEGRIAALQTHPMILYHRHVERRPCYRARPTGSVPSVGRCSTNPVWQKRVIRHVVVRTTELTSATRTRPFLPRPISLTIFQLRFTRRGLAAAPQAGKLAASPTHKQNAGAQFRKPAVHFFGCCFSEPALVANCGSVEAANC